MATLLERAIVLALDEMADNSRLCTDPDCGGHAVEAGAVNGDGSFVLGIRDSRLFAAELAATLTNATLQEAYDRGRLREHRWPYRVSTGLRKWIEEVWASA